MKIYLSPITEEDGALIVKWRNTPSVSAHCFNRVPVTLESNRIFYDSQIKTGRYKQYIVNRIDEDYGVAAYPIATVYLKDIDVTNHRCELCVFTSDDQEWNTESQKMAINQLLYIAFSELNMHKVYSYVFSVFDDEIALLESAGFQREAILKQEALATDGGYWDAYRMVIFAQ